MLMFGSFDVFVELKVLPDIEAGNLCRTDMVDVVAALRRWEEDGTWGRPVSTKLDCSIGLPSLQYCAIDQGNKTKPEARNEEPLCDIGV